MRTDITWNDVRAALRIFGVDDIKGMKEFTISVESVQYTRMTVENGVVSTTTLERYIPSEVNNMRGSGEIS